MRTPLACQVGSVVQHWLVTLWNVFQFCVEDRLFCFDAQFAHLERRRSRSAFSRNLLKKSNAEQMAAVDWKKELSFDMNGDYRSGSAWGISNWTIYIPLGLFCSGNFSFVSPLN